MPGATLFRLEAAAPDDVARWAVVHLTWISRAPDRPPWPETVVRDTVPEARKVLEARNY